ncbi:MAG: hypothetical protein D3923_19070, partial [Candidatus Electrothrix sp. AR3]|nr:hypothetical protein [Candidatus Electrothrix sp. AR3]
MNNLAALKIKNMIMPSLQQKILRTLTDSCRINKGTELVVAVSGGPDSMALLHLLADTPLQLVLTAVWVDHGLRPTETGLEKEVVSQSVKRLGV